MASLSKNIRLYNVFREVDDDYHLSIDELYLYSILRRLVNYNSETVVSVDLLEQYSNVPFRSRSSESKDVIKKTLLSLMEKGLIQTDGETITNKQVLHITFSEMDKLGKYENISFDLFDNVTDKTLFYIYFVVSSWKGLDNGFSCSYNRWADILNMTAKTAEKYVNSAVDKGIIYCNVGDYSDDEIRSGQKQRTSNQYSIYPFKNEDKSNIQRKQDRKDNEQSKVENQSTLDNIVGDSNWGDNPEYPFDTGNWLNNNNLDVNDYVIYLEQKQKDDSLSKDFVAECEKKFSNILNKNSKFEYIHKKNIEQAKDKIDKKYMDRADSIIDNTDDVAVLVDGKLIPYNNWNGQSKVDRVYYKYGEWESEVNNFVYEVHYTDMSDNEEVEQYRPDVNGEWDNNLKNDEKKIKIELED